MILPTVCSPEFLHDTIFICPHFEARLYSYNILDSVYSFMNGKHGVILNERTN